jgi:polysaccharide deacetylase 2 family uncharacterized protein YibQ
MNGRSFGATAVGAIGGIAAGLALAFSLPARPDAASGSAEAALDLRDAPIAVARMETGSALVAPERLAPGVRDEPPATDTLFRPKIILIVDDVGLDRTGFERVMDFPGPLTLSILPYARDAQILADRAVARGDAVMLHLPMEASGGAGPGPGALDTDMSPQALFAALSDNLAAFEGYRAVNNHMGSRFTRDMEGMKRVLAALDARGLVFIDSVTTGESVAREAGLSVGARVFARDVFLDADPGRAAVKAQIERAEAIARETGYVIAICHPRADTLAMIGAWLTSAPARGFELATIDVLTGEKPQISVAMRD